MSYYFSEVVCLVSFLVLQGGGIMIWDLEIPDTGILWEWGPRDWRAEVRTKVENVRQEGSEHEEALLVSCDMFLPLQGEGRREESVLSPARFITFFTALWINQFHLGKSLLSVCFMAGPVISNRNTKIKTTKSPKSQVSCYPKGYNMIEERNAPTSNCKVSS